MAHIIRRWVVRCRMTLFRSSYQTLLFTSFCLNLRTTFLLFVGLVWLGSSGTCTYLFFLFLFLFASCIYVSHQVSWTHTSRDGRQKNHHVTDHRALDGLAGSRIEDTSLGGAGKLEASKASFAWVGMGGWGGFGPGLGSIITAARAAAAQSNQLYVITVHVHKANQGHEHEASKCCDLGLCKWQWFN
ncbi:hypothetical protein QBC44DRAFT_45191 [Cladorrhinum sp. PSN332]|nr:hypothetical protein QBC44DRAFT_45191 [Cladorrhinum sp. PSN332]